MLIAPVLTIHPGYSQLIFPLSGFYYLPQNPEIGQRCGRMVDIFLLLRIIPVPLQVSLPQHILVGTVVISVEHLKCTEPYPRIYKHIISFHRSYRENPLGYLRKRVKWQQGPY